MIGVGEALRSVLARARPLAAETLALADAGGRVLAEPLVASRDVPGFINAQMDGWAVRAEDLVGAYAGEPRPLRVKGRVAAGGEQDLPTLPPGGAVRVFTGAVLPAGADAVVMQEVCRLEGEGEGSTVWIGHEPRPGEYVRRGDEDLRRGAPVLSAGTVLGPLEMGLLASLGAESLVIRARPRVTVVTTGDELVPVGTPLVRGQVHDSNAWVLRGLVAEHGAVPVAGGIVRDDPAATEAALRHGLACDVLLTTGGVSVGDRDLVRPVLESLGVEPIFWGVAQKPGKPLWFGVRENTLVFGLPGNPVSAVVCFLLYVAPALRRLAGRTDLFLPSSPAVMGVGFESRPGICEFVRCRHERMGSQRTLVPAGTQSSGALSVLAAADALAVVPPGRSRVVAGDVLDALWLRPVEAWQPGFGAGVE